jgi:hypothetical protein
LLKKYGEGTAFLNEAVNEALDAMVVACSPSKLLTSLIASSDHRNPMIRGKTANLLLGCITSLPTQTVSKWIQGPETLKLLPSLLSLAQDGLAETRNDAKRILSLLAEIGGADFDRATHKALNHNQAEKLREILAQFKQKIASTANLNTATGGRRTLRSKSTEA